MKVLLVNGSPNETGSTYLALEEIKRTLNEEGVEADFFWIGKKPVSGCIACGKCKQLHACVFGDKVNEFMDLAKEYDGFIFGSPVYFAGINGSLMSFLDRVFYSAQRYADDPLQFKPAAGIVVARRAGTSSALDQLHKYFQYQQMPIITSRYWNMVHGEKPEDVAKDEEGMQIMRALARNMAWFLRLRAAGDAAGVQLPEQEKRIKTNFIR